jgi:membrane protease YdiL (CAAX protease family)
MKITSKLNIESSTGPLRFNQKRLNWKIFGIFLFWSIVTTMALVPYYLTLIHVSNPTSAQYVQAFADIAIEHFFFTALATAIGLGLGDRIGLGIPMLRAWLAGDPQAPQQFLAALPASMGIGFATALAIVLIELLLPIPQGVADAVDPPPWQGALASLSGGIFEEIMDRLGLMTLFAWLGMRLLDRERLTPPIAWTAIILTALLFGLLHLPTAIAQAGILSFALLLKIMLLNGIAGIAFGWLYWRKGLLLAMVAHFSCDIVLHVM